MKKVDNYLLYLSGVISENQYHEAKNDTPDVDGYKPGVDSVKIKNIIPKLSVKLGEKTNTYLPLLRYVSKNEKALSLFSELIESLVLVQTSRVKGIVEPKNSEDADPEVMRMVQRLSSKLGEKTNRYVPLIRWILKNKDMVELFERLVRELSLMSPGRGKNIIK